MIAEGPPYVLYGSSGHARGIREMFRLDVVAFIDDVIGDGDATIAGIPIVSFATWERAHREVPCLMTVGDPRHRRAMAERITAAGGTFGTLNTGLYLADSVTVGEGSIVVPPVYAGSSTTIGRHVQVMPMVTIGHDCAIGDYVSLCPSASVSGNVVIEDEVFVGVGATILNGTARRPLRIGRGAQIAAGAVVTKSVAANAKVAGNPARPLRELAAESRVARGGKDSHA